MVDLKKILNPDDRDVIDATGGTNWVPKEPRKALLPYKVETTVEEVLDVDKRREKAKQVVDGYNVIAEECRRVEAELEERCKSVEITLSKGKHLRVMEALGRVFGQGLQTKITFEQYKLCIQELTRINNQLPEG
jgi:hypothetical protein